MINDYVPFEWLRAGYSKLYWQLSLCVAIEVLIFALTDNDIPTAPLLFLLKAHFDDFWFIMEV